MSSLQDLQKLYAALKDIPPNNWPQDILPDLQLLVQQQEQQNARQKLESSLYEYVKTAWNTIESAPFVDNWHISLICNALQEVTTGAIPKLLINIPPGCSKSLLVSVFWPTWEWAINPSIRFFYASYDQRLSTRDSVKCRALINSPWYQSIWKDKYVLVHDANQKTYYETNHGGYRLATSAGGHGTGEHPDRIVADDIHNVQQAESDVERQSVIDWWDLTMSTRGVSRQARRVIVMQRLHHQDLSGHVLEQGDWVHICLPMRYEVSRSDQVSSSIAKPLCYKDLTAKSENSVEEATASSGKTARGGKAALVGSISDPTKVPSPRQEQSPGPASAVNNLLHTEQNINKTHYLETSSFQDNPAQSSVDDKNINISHCTENPSNQENSTGTYVDESGVVLYPLMNICGGQEVGVPTHTTCIENLGNEKGVPQQEVAENKNSVENSESDFENEKHSLNKEVESEKIPGKKFSENENRKACLDVDPRTEEGELLTPIQFSDSAVRIMERSLGIYGSSGQLQQRPVPREGGMFKFQFFNNRRIAAPYEARRIRYWDRAATQGAGCYTAGVLMSVDAHGSYFVEHVVRGQWEPDERNEIMKATALRDRRRYGPTNEPRIFVEAEGGSSGRDAWRGVVRALAGFPVWEDRVSGRKEVRAEPWACQLAALNVYLVDDHTWDINAYIQEHCQFPLGAYLDQVDASSGAFNSLIRTAPISPLRVIQLQRKKKKGMLRIMVCSYEQAKLLTLDEKCLLVFLNEQEKSEDPVYLPAPVIPKQEKELGRLELTFDPLDPKDVQDNWQEEKIANLNIFTAQLAKKLWAFLMKPRDPGPEVFVLIDHSDNLALSLAYGLADALRLRRQEVIYQVGKEEWSASATDVPPHRYLFEQTKATRSLVVE